MTAVKDFENINVEILVKQRLTDKKQDETTKN